MIRSHLVARRQAEANGFRWRGREVSRLEGLSDAVFGFAITRSGAESGRSWAGSSTGWSAR